MSRKRLGELMCICINAIEGGEKIPKSIGRELWEEHTPYRYKDGMAWFDFTVEEEGMFDECAIVVDDNGNVKLERGRQNLFSRFYI